MIKVISAPTEPMPAMNQAILMPAANSTAAAPTMIRMVLHQHLLVCQVNLLLGSVWPAYENPFPKLL